MHNVSDIAVYPVAMRSRDRITTHNIDQVADLINARREALGLSVAELARMAGASYKAAWNATQGRVAIDPARRAAWENALGWEAGSITAAYDTGVEPALRDKPDQASSTVAPAAPSARQLLAEANLPADVRPELESLLDQLDQLGISAAEQYKVAADWISREREIVRLDTERRRLLGEQQRTLLRAVSNARPRSAG